MSVDLFIFLPYRRFRIGILLIQSLLYLLSLFLLFRTLLLEKFHTPHKARRDLQQSLRASKIDDPIKATRLADSRAFIHPRLILKGLYSIDTIKPTRGKGEVPGSTTNEIRSVGRPPEQRGRVLGRRAARWDSNFLVACHSTLKPFSGESGDRAGLSRSHLTQMGVIDLGIPSMLKPIEPFGAEGSGWRQEFIFEIFLDSLY